MADLPAHRGFDGIDMPEDVQKQYMEVKIQEIRSRIARITQDIEDLERGKITELKANRSMLELSLKDWEAKRDAIEVKSEEK